jgi:hypothetical protein
MPYDMVERSMTAFGEAVVPRIRPGLRRPQPPDGCVALKEQNESARWFPKNAGYSAVFFNTPWVPLLPRRNIALLVSGF